jgi:hypothetical protein
MIGRYKTVSSCTVTLLLIFGGLAASSIPARRAAMVDPNGATTNGVVRRQPKAIRSLSEEEQIVSEEKLI